MNLSKYLTQGENALEGKKQISLKKIHHWDYKYKVVENTPRCHNVSDYHLMFPTNI